MALATFAIPVAVVVGALVGWRGRDGGWSLVVVGLPLCGVLWLLTDPLSSTDRTIVFSSAALLYVAAASLVPQLRSTRR